MPFNSALSSLKMFSCQNRRKPSRRSIVLAVDAIQLYLITSCEQPKEAWNVLKKRCERETLPNKFFLKKQHFRSEMEEGKLMNQHLGHMKDLTDRLAAIGAPFTEEDLVVTLLGSLPRSYATVLTALEARVEDISLDFVPQCKLSGNETNACLTNRV